MSFLLVLLRYVWAFPATLLGLFFLPPALLLRWHCSFFVQGVLEIQGGFVAAFLRRGLPVLGPAAAMTLGHVILGRDQSCLDRSRRHQHVHVRQYERWGPLIRRRFTSCSAASCGCGALIPIWDNPFEREAFEEGE